MALDLSTIDPSVLAELPPDVLADLLAGRKPNISFYDCNLDLCDAADSLFNYQPSFAANLTYAILFAIVLLITPFFAWRYKTYTFSILMSLGCIGEILGYAGRIWGHYDPWSIDGFLLQICALTLSPTFFAASIYITLSKLVGLIGQDISRFNRWWYTYFFLTCDIISLILQGTGGGIAAVSAKAENKNGKLDTGNKIMIAGLIFQVITLGFFIIMSLEYFWRAKRAFRLSDKFRGKQGLKLKIFLFSLGLSTVLILIRCIFRVVELWDGWTSELMSNEKKFIALEGGMVIAAAVFLTLFNPGWGFGREHSWDEKKRERDMDLDSE
ncbi:putative RTA1 domain protein [Ascobolus immersus RN42]|uniref:Putative RTA1 domain protein n=1 Tax=Ascobolus immersus RN42 TaxID=1160509 RepID=A0A3N4I8M2_ASCIM|nr:putative RTA1 domain protein [Ascobolus immersus RN42]